MVREHRLTRTAASSISGRHRGLHGQQCRVQRLVVQRRHQLSLGRIKKVVMPAFSVDCGVKLGKGGGKRAIVVGGARNPGKEVQVMMSLAHPRLTMQHRVPSAGEDCKFSVFFFPKLLIPSGFMHVAFLVHTSIFSFLPTSGSRASPAFTISMYIHQIFAFLKMKVGAPGR